MKRAILLAGLLAIPLASRAASDDKKEEKRTVSVQGQGKISAVPDIAMLTIEVRQEGASLDAVSEQVRRGIAKVLDGLKAQGIADKDIQTVAYQVRPRYERDKPGNMRPNGFIVENRVAAKVRDLKKVGKVLAAVVQSGATSVTGPDFDFDNPQALERKALALAMDDARAKAAVLAEAAGAHLGPVESISQSGDIAWPMAPRPMLGMRMAAAAAAPAEEPISAGEQAFRSNVQVTFEIR